MLPSSVTFPVHMSQSGSIQLPLDAGTCPIELVPKPFSHLKLLHIIARGIRVNGKLAEL